MTTITPDFETCLCGSELSYTACCGRYHEGAERPDTAERLMRSRFTAYAKRNVDYLLNTWDASKRPTEIDFSKETAQWQKLQIISCKKAAPRTVRVSSNSKPFIVKTVKTISCMKSAASSKAAGVGCIWMA